MKNPRSTKPIYPVIAPGKRCLAVGRTGSGKSEWSRWMIRRSPLKWVVIDMKIDQGFDGMGKTIQDLPDVNKMFKI